LVVAIATLFAPRILARTRHDGPMTFGHATRLTGPEQPLPVFRSLPAIEGALGWLAFVVLMLVALWAMTESSSPEELPAWRSTRSWRAPPASS